MAAFFVVGLGASTTVVAAAGSGSLSLAVWASALLGCTGLGWRNDSRGDYALGAGLVICTILVAPASPLFIVPLTVLAVLAFETRALRRGTLQA